MQPAAHEEPPARQPNLRGIRRLSMVLAWCCIGFVALSPLVHVWLWATIEPATLAAQLGLPPTVVQGNTLATLDPWQRAFGALVTMVPVGLMIFALLRARRCFLLFAVGRFFEPGTVRALRGFAAGMFWSAIAALAIQPLLTGLFTLGSGSLHLALNLSPLSSLFVSGTVWVIAWVMARAVLLAQDHASIV